jgi:hypothetical protein
MKLFAAALNDCLDNPGSAPRFGGGNVTCRPRRFIVVLVVWMMSKFNGAPKVVER